MKEFEMAEIELIRLAASDVITTSTGGNGSQDQNADGNGNSF